MTIVPYHQLQKEEWTVSFPCLLSDGGVYTVHLLYSLGGGMMVSQTPVYETSSVKEVVELLFLTESHNLNEIFESDWL